MGIREKPERGAVQFATFCFGNYVILLMNASYSNFDLSINSARTSLASRMYLGRSKRLNIFVNRAPTDRYGLSQAFDRLDVLHRPSRIDFH